MDFCFSELATKSCSELSVSGQHTLKYHYWGYFKKKKKSQTIHSYLENTDSVQQFVFMHNSVNSKVESPLSDPCVQIKQRLMVTQAAKAVYFYGS